MSPDERVQVGSVAKALPATGVPRLVTLDRIEFIDPAQAGHNLFADAALGVLVLHEMEVVMATATHFSRPHPPRNRNVEQRRGFPPSERLKTDSGLANSREE